MRYFKRHKLFTIVLLFVSIFIYINYTSMLEVKTSNRNNPYYVNDLYSSDQRIYNNYLTKNEKKAYDMLMEYIKDRKVRLFVNKDEFDNNNTSEIAGYFSNAYLAIIVDHPELLNFGYISYGYSDTEVKVHIFYSINNPIMEEINTLKIRKMINDIRIRTMGMDDLEKIKYVYDWIGSNTHYDTLFTELAKNQSIYNVFIKKNAVCAGFSKASQVIFQNIGIDSMSVIGNTSMLHMWNIVKYNGKYYYYDSTWAASYHDKNNKNYYGGLIQENMNDYVLINNWYPTVEKENALYK